MPSWFILSFSSSYSLVPSSVLEWYSEVIHSKFQSKMNLDMKRWAPSFVYPWTSAVHHRIQSSLVSKFTIFLNFLWIILKETKRIPFPITHWFPSLQPTESSRLRFGCVTRSNALLITHWPYKYVKSETYLETKTKPIFSKLLTLSLQEFKTIREKVASKNLPLTQCFSLQESQTFHHQKISYSLWLKKKKRVITSIEAKRTIRISTKF